MGGGVAVEVMERDVPSRCWRNMRLRRLEGQAGVSIQKEGTHKEVRMRVLFPRGGMSMGVKEMCSRKGEEGMATLLRSQASVVEGRSVLRKHCQSKSLTLTKKK